MANHIGLSSATNPKDILDYDQLPAWMKSDPYIKFGYRRQLNSFRGCFLSLFYLHNEFVNVWSHLLPAIAYLVSLAKLDVYIFDSGFTVPATDMFVFQLCIICTAFCLLLSAIYHCTSSHSEQISRYFLKLDYFGILINVVGNNASAAYFGFYGHPFIQVPYVLFFIIGTAVVLRRLLRYGVDGPCAFSQRYFLFHPCPRTRKCQH